MKYQVRVMVTFETDEAIADANYTASSHIKYGFASQILTECQIFVSEKEEYPFGRLPTNTSLPDETKTLNEARHEAESEKTPSETV